MNERTFEQHLAEGDPDKIRAAIEHTRMRVAILKYTLGILIVGLVVLALVSGLTTRSDGLKQGRKSEQAVRELTAELDQARSDRSEVDLCQSKFDTLVGNASRESNVGETELVILIATVVPEEREAVIGSKVAELRDAAAQYRKAGQDRSAWVDAGKPLPCPI